MLLIVITSLHVVLQAVPGSLRDPGPPSASVLIFSRLYSLSELPGSGKSVEIVRKRLQIAILLLALSAKLTTIHHNDAKINPRGTEHHRFLVIDSLSCGGQLTISMYDPAEIDQASRTLAAKREN
jgi:hypothetical protein